jgi:hypothetical protein
MSININSLWIVLGITVLLSTLFGYGFGWFEWGRKLKALEAEKANPKPEEPKVDAPVLPQPRQESPSLLALRESMGRLRLELDGQMLDVSTMTPEQRKRLIDVVSRLRPWIETRATPTPAPTPEAAPAPISVPSAAVPTPTRPAPAAPAKKGETLAPLSMVAQIDEILQQRLTGTPLEDKGIKLVETPGGGVTVIVGIQRFAGVGEVTDPEVQAAIRAAIAAWERKFTPG